MTVPPEILAAARGASTVVVMTGAGMSAESGLATFREEHTGLWSRFAPEDLATPVAWERNRTLVWAWYQWRAGLVLAAKPNAGHLALARWAESADLRIVAQNVDDLHERAGSAVAHHLHGSLFDPRCDTCAAQAPMTAPPSEPAEHLDPPTCEVCAGSVRPGVVWFGEVPNGIEESAALVEAADLMVVVGTSGVVHPAAGLVDTAVSSGVPVVEVNPDPSSRPGVIAWRSTAATALPALVDALRS